MVGNYEKSMCNQLMEVMARLDAVEKDLHVEKIEHKEDVDRLNEKIDGLTQENKLLRDDNAHLKSIINNNCSNTSLPPSTDEKGSRPHILLMAEKKAARKLAEKRAQRCNFNQS